MHRRQFLSVGAGGAAVVGGGGTYLGLRRSTELPTPIGPLFCLDDVSFGVLAVVASTVIPEATRSVEVAHGVDQSLRQASVEAQADFNFVLKVLENSLSGWLTRGKAQLFSMLSPEERTEALRRWSDNSVEQLRGATNAVRKLCLGAYYAPPARQDAMGYPGPPSHLRKPDPGPITARGPLSEPWSLG